MDLSSEPPIKEGEVINDLKVIGVGRKGDGICKISGFVIIVPNTQLNETYNVKVNKVLTSVAFGEVHN